MKRFGTFEGVFTPCLLSILGVIMYLRLGWVVGNLGFLGAFWVIALANAITLATALSMSSVVTNIRIGAGGAYSIITKSLGLEAGGAIGLPLYISQALSIGFYITGFAECWTAVFVHHSMLFVSLVAWLVLLVVSYFSAKLAFRLQYGIMAFIFLSLISVFMGSGESFLMSDNLAVVTKPQGFWVVFAVFFPAVTGILAGASMSGELTDPRRSIPLGTLAAIGISFILYVVLSFWFFKKVPGVLLRENNSILLEMGRWRSLVVAGIMGATLSSALSMFVGAPRILMALGKHSLFPGSSPFARVNQRGEPASAILMTALIVLTSILFGSLNDLAALLTMFFLVTYGMINVTVFIEQSIGIASFRPSFRIPKIVPLLGTVGCLAVMFLINVKFGFLALFVIGLSYVVLLKKGVQVYSPDVRSGLLVFMAEQLAKAAGRLPYYPKIWKPNLFIPVESLERLKQLSGFLRAIILPSGRLTIVKIVDQENLKEIYSLENVDRNGEEPILDPLKQLSQDLAESVEPLQDDGIFVETTVVESPDLLIGTVAVLQTVKGMFFPPNTLFYGLEDEEDEKDSVAAGIIERAADEGLGVIVLKYNPKTGFSQEKIINIWIRRHSPNMDLSILIALQLQRNWQGQVRMIHVVSYEDEKEEALDYLERLKELMRMPMDVENKVLVGQFQKVIHEAPSADINIFGMPEKPDIPMIRETAAAVQTSVLFLRDSKNESALA